MAFTGNGQVGIDRKRQFKKAIKGRSPSRDISIGGSASPIEDGKYADGSDAISDWPLLNALLNCSAMADLVAFMGWGWVCELSER
jgi:urocanate hydratase